jgi:tRNA-dihydrouridine synthase 4
MLCRAYGADVAFTPMLMAADFRRTQPLDLDEFSTSPEDRPLIAQFASREPSDLAHAAECISPYVDAIDLNCGCPQKWILKERLGASLSGEPQVVKEMVAAVRARLPDMPMSIKIRLRPDLRETVELVQRAEHAGVSWITVHGMCLIAAHTHTHTHTHQHSRTRIRPHRRRANRGSCALRFDQVCQGRG